MFSQFELLELPTEYGEVISQTVLKPEQSEIKELPGVPALIMI